jgi:hypothetical protein
MVIFLAEWHGLCILLPHAIKIQITLYPKPAKGYGVFIDCLSVSIAAFRIGGVHA